MLEAFSFVAKEDGPVDVINVYLQAAHRNARVVAGIYANTASEPPGRAPGHRS